MRFINYLIATIGFVLMTIGGCGICDEMGNFSVTAFVLAIIGVAMMYTQGRRFTC